MANDQATTATEVALPVVGNSKDSQIIYVARERQTVIQQLALQSKKQRKAPDPNLEPSKSLYQRLDLLSNWLQIEAQMSPEIKQKTQIDKGLTLMYSNPMFHFPALYVQKAKELLERWENEKWGANEIVDDADIGDEGVADVQDKTTERPAKRRKQSATTKSQKGTISDEIEEIATLRQPPANHPIFGTEGIMHGVAVKQGKRRNYILDPRYQKRNAKAYGHNGLEVGSWFPMQIIALFRGAHGSAMGGIAGDKETGAYSIVVAGQYDDLDRDYGDYIYYSGSNSHDNEDPKNPAPSSAATLTLHASRATERPVRVLRASSGKSKFRPTCGLRYDGLYQVVTVQYPYNSKGGKYEQFKLERLDDQPEIQRMRPTPTEIRDFEKIADGIPRT